MIKLADQSRLLKDNAIVFVGSIATSIVNFLFYPFLGRFIEPTQFGEVQVIATLMIEAGLIFGLARIAIMNEVLNAESSDSHNKTVEFAERLLLQFSFIIIGLGILFSPLIARQLKLDSPIPILLAAPAMVFLAINSTRDAYLRAKGRLATASAIQLVSALTKLVVGFVLVAIGFGTLGGLIGVLGAYAAMAVLSMRYSRLEGLIPDLTKLHRLEALRSLFRKGNVTRKGAHTITVAFASLIIVVISGFDTVLAKSLLSPEQAGLYAGMSVIGNITFFASASVAAVLMSSIKIAMPKNLRISKYILSALITVGIGGSAVLIMWVIPSFVTKVMLGAEYESLSYILPKLALAMFAMALLNLIVSYHIAVRDVRIAVVATGCFLVITGSILTSHHSPDAISAGYLRGSIISFILALAWTIYWHKTHDKQHQVTTAHN